jgi:hypothetical protein
MKLDKWTLALASAGVVSLAGVANAEEQVMSQVLTSVSQTTLSGYIDTSMIWKFGTGNQWDDGRGIPGRWNDGTGYVDGFNLHVVNLTLEKVPGEENWAAGYKAEIIYGPDAVGYSPSYLALSNSGGDATSELSIKQAYVDLVVPTGTGLDFKMGVFDTIIGYEVFASHENPNFGRSYGWQLEPTQHTGLLSSYQFTDAVGIAAGIANTWTPVVNERVWRRDTDGGDPREIESMKTYMGALALTAPDSWGALSGSQLVGGVVNGFSGQSQGGLREHNTTSSYVGFTLNTGVEGLAFGGALDYRSNGNLETSAENWAWAAAGYITYQASEKLGLAARADFTKGSNGTWYDNQLLDGSTDENGLFGLTLTADYALWANVLTRAEFRWDTCTTGDQPFPTHGENALSLAADVVYKF